MRLEDLVGQDQAITVLRRAIATARVPHAYLFEGPNGVGKRNAAIGLAMALNCETPTAAPTSAPDGHDDATRAAGRDIDRAAACGHCDSCRRIAGGLHPDVVTYAPDGPQIVMEQAQEIVALGQRRPHEGRARVVIIDDADRLNTNAANCLLKTLEEPSPGTHIVLVTAAPDRLLGTIRSRAQRVRFRAVALETLIDMGVRGGIDRSQAEVAAIVADGCVARFLELASNVEDHETRDAAAALRAAARGSGISRILDAASDLGDKESKQRLPEALSLLARVYRDAMVTVVGAPELAVLTAGRAVSARGVDDTGDTDDAGDDPLAPPTGLSVSALGRAMAAIVEADTALTGNVNAVMALERLLLNLRREERAAA